MESVDFKRVVFGRASKTVARKRSLNYLVCLIKPRKMLAVELNLNAVSKDSWFKIAYLPRVHGREKEVKNGF